MGVDIFEECDKCGGSGEIEHEGDCLNCGGRGKIFSRHEPGPVYQELGFDSLDDFEDNMF